MHHQHLDVFHTFHTVTVLFTNVVTVWNEQNREITIAATQPLYTVFKNKIYGFHLHGYHRICRCCNNVINCGSEYMLKWLQMDSLCNKTVRRSGRLNTKLGLRVIGQCIILCISNESLIIIMAYKIISGMPSVLPFYLPIKWIRLSVWLSVVFLPP